VPLPVRHYYHVYAAGAWQAPVREHIAALAASGLRAEMVVGLVGPPAARRAAASAASALLGESGLPEVRRWAEADEGWEQVTLDEVHADVHRIPGDSAVLYTHTKGASDPSALNAAWRRSMTARVVSGWRECLSLLEEGHDTAGCHWVTQRDDATAFYAGNFWMATAAYLRTLPPPPRESRWQAETWVSSASGPRAADVLPGWPQYAAAVP